MKATSRTWPVIPICAVCSFGLAVVDAQGEGGCTAWPSYAASPQVTEQEGAGERAPARLLPYSNDAVDVGTVDFDDQLAEEVAAFSSSLEEGRQMSIEQQARMADLLREEREAATRALAPAGYDVNLLHRALQKGVAPDEAGLQLMQDSLERLLARLADVLSPMQLQQFAALEQQKLDAQCRLLQMRRNSRSERDLGC